MTPLWGDDTMDDCPVAASVGWWGSYRRCGPYTEATILGVRYNRAGDIWRLVAGPFALASVGGRWTLD